MRDPLRVLAHGLQALLLAAAMTSAVHADPCDNDKTADRAMIEAQRAAERAQRMAEQIAARAQIAAEKAANVARWAAEHASEQAQQSAEQAQARAEQAAARAQRDAERAAREAERAAERAAIGAPGVVVTNDAILFVDGPEVPRDAVQWASDARSRRMRQPITTDTTLNVDRGSTLSLTNLSGDITVRVWDRSAVRVNAEHDKSDQFVATTKDGMLKLSVSAAEGEPADVDWNITVPAWLPLEISGIESEIAVTGLRAPVRAISLRGDVHVTSCKGPMELNSTEGEVHAEDVDGNISASSINSVVRLVRVLGPIEAQSINGDIQMDDVSSAKVIASTMNGRVYYASKFQPHGRYAFSSHNGKVYVGVDKSQPMNVTVSSFNGQLESSIPVPPAPPEAPTPPAPRTMTWRSWNFSLPAEAASTPAPSPTPSAAHMKVKAKYMAYPPQAGDAPHAPEVELESFGGIIQLASRAEIERALQLRQAMRDSADAVRRLSRLRSMRAHERARGDQDAPKPDEDPDKN
jgi:multidrug efflux pump subunit AcrA (membrane-fusion protein)